MLDIEQELKTFNELNIDALSHRELKHWVKWKAVIEPNMDKAESVIQRGRRFLRADNLKKVLSVGLDPKERKLFAKFLDEIALN